jgi:beta-mannosidase
MSLNKVVALMLMAWFTPLIICEDGSGSDFGESRLSLSGRDWRVFDLTPHYADWSEWVKIFEADQPLYPLRVSAPYFHSPIPAHVPGAVQDDCVRAGLIPDPYAGLNSFQAEWVSERDWVYSREFTLPEARKGRNAYLHFEGVDYECLVYLNGRKLGEHRGMYDAFEFKVTDQLRWGEPNRLVVIVRAAPPMEGQIGWTNRVKEWKARFAYQWDFSTRLIPLGIWDDVWVEFTGPVRITDVWVRPALNEALTAATLKLQITVEAATALDGLSVEAAIRTDVKADQTGESDQVGASVLARDVSFQVGRRTLNYELRMPQVKLWWPNDHGPQVMNSLTINLHNKQGTILASDTVPFGLRALRVVPNESAPPEALPYTVVINNKKIFIKGWNWVPADQLYGRVDDARYERLLTLVKKAHCNLLRVWGGGLIEKQKFYDLCDRYGILVWQEFIQSSSGIDNEPSRDPAYLAYIEDQARKIVLRRRNHPSLVIWCGGNELMEPGMKPLTLGHPTNTVLRKVLAELDPDRIFLPTSPSGPRFDSTPDYSRPKDQWRDTMHDVHGNWLFEGVVEQYRHYNEIEPLYHSEFGVEAATGMAEALRIAPLDKLWPADLSNPLWAHHASWWTKTQTVEQVWGPINNLEALVRYSQFIQADALRYSVEANRRRKFRTSGESPWQFNEPWPNLACTNAVSYYLEPRPAYWWVRHAYEPLHVSLRHDGLAQKGKTEYRAQVWLNNALDARTGLKLEATISDLGGKTFSRHSQEVSIGVNTAEHVGDILWKYPEGFHGIFLVSLKVRSGNAVESANVYLHSTAPDPVLGPLRQAPTAQVQVRMPDTRTISLKNTGNAWALGVWIDLPGSYLGDNYLFLPPGEETNISVEGQDARTAQVSWWNR